MFTRLLTAGVFGLLLGFSGMASALCPADSMRQCLGCAPTGAQVKQFLGVNTVLFEDDVRYNYKATPDCGNGAQLTFVRADMSPMSTRPFPEYQLPVFIRASIDKQCDGSYVTNLPQ